MKNFNSATEWTFFDADDYLIGNLRMNAQTGEEAVDKFNRLHDKPEAAKLMRLAGNKVAAMAFSDDRMMHR